MNIEEKVKDIYPTVGFNKTKKLLKIGDKRLRGIIEEYKLEKNGKVKIDLSDKNLCYLLGLIWSDGYLGLKSNTVYIECIESDMLRFKTILESISKWSYYRRERSGNITICSYLTDKNFYNFLVDNEYLIKSSSSPGKIWNLLPDFNRKYFLLGIIDGDGCFYFNKERYVRQLSITGSLNQNWELIEEIFSSLDIKYTISRLNGEKSGYSQIRITNKKDINKLGNFIFYDLIVLERKYQTYKLMIE